MMGGAFVTSASMKLTRPSRPLRFTLCRLTSIASGLTSERTTRVCGRASAMAQPMQPEPLHRSRTRASIFRPCSQFIAVSARTSVSTLGMSTAGETSIGRPRNSQTPVI